VILPGARVWQRSTLVIRLARRHLVQWIPMLRKTTSLLIAVVALAAVAIVPAARAQTAPPRLIGPPTVRYVISSNASNGRFVTLGAIFRLDRRFTDVAEQHRYTIVAGTRLHRGQILPDELFGGGTIGRFPRRAGAWYEAEAVQLRKHASVRNGARWEIALARGKQIVGPIKHVTLRRGTL
jgi:hypothetical protein